MLSLLLGAVVGLSILTINKTSAEVYSFPETFKIGAASASYQIEGGWNEDGKTANIWDTIVHNNPSYIRDRSNGDVAADSYHMFEKDLDALDNIKFEVYRFSISWARIIPNGSRVNMKGIEYYGKILDGLEKRNIEPLVTIFHWDLPQYIQDVGGWTNPLIVDYFREYADVLFEHFGARVKNWITVNEPSVFCAEGYGYATKAPGINSPGVADYLCAHYVLLANAAAYRLYKEKYFEKHHGQVGICLNSGFNYVLDETVDQSYSEKAQEFELGRFTNPIFSMDGGYPQIMIDSIGNKSKAEGRPWSRLPEFTEEQKKFVLNTADFIALNYYSSGRIKPIERTGDTWPIGWWSDNDMEGFHDSSWKRAKSTWLYSVPEGLREVLKWIKRKYDNPTVMITENGWSDDGQLNDDDRVEYLKLHLASLIRAIREDNCNIVAYTVWSLTDNFEWKEGYIERFGIHSIDFTSPTKERIPKRSADFFKEMMKTKSFEV